MKSSSKKWFIRLTTTLIVTLSVGLTSFFASDHWARNRWNEPSSWIVTLEKATLLPLSPDDKPSTDDETFASRAWRAQVTYRTGRLAGTQSDVTIEHLVNSALKLVPGRDYVMVREDYPDGTSVSSLADRWRLPWVVSTLACTACLLIFVAGIAGLRALLGLGLSLWYLSSVFLHQAAGTVPLQGALVAVAVISLVTVGLVVRRRRYWPAALAGALGGGIAAWLLGQVALSLWGLTGLNSDGSLVLATTVTVIPMGQIFLASIIIGAMGAVHDVAISVSAAMAELEDYDPDIAPLRLWRSGMAVGREMLGTMVNTLVLAYFGSSLCLLVLMALAHPEARMMLNDGQLAEEIAQSLAGTLGLLLTVPITAAAGALTVRIRRRRHR